MTKRNPDLNSFSNGFHNKMHRLRDFLLELWRRKVIRAAATYLVAAWVLIEVSSVIVDAFNTPEFILQILIGLVIAGLPVVMALAWVFDLTAKGLVLTDEVDAEDEEPQTLSLRRHMTMLSAAINVETHGDVDPEHLLELQPAAMQLVRKVCKRFGGHLLAGHGGEVLAYFGYPVASEDDSLRAIRAALGLVEGIDRLERSRRKELNISISAHAAVHTGEVITEESDIDGDGQPDIFGVLPGAATALMKQGSSDQVLISADTERIVTGYFNVVTLGERSLGDSGFSEVFQVLHESGARNRLEAIPEQELTPLVGRDHELGMLKQNWQRAREGDGQVVLVVGGPGIGKSRIVHALRKLAANGSSAWVVELVCQSMQQNTALHPVTDYLWHDVLDLDGAEGAGEKLDQIEGMLAEYNQDLEKSVPLLAALLQVPLLDRYLPPGYSPQLQRKATMELLVDLFTELTLRQPVLFVVEDLHWVDPTSLEMLSMLIDEVPAHALMLVMTVRTPFESPWANVSQVSQLNLDRLDVNATRTVLAQLGAALPALVLAGIAAKTDGVPLFIEEVTKSVVESGVFNREMSEADMQDLIEMVLPATVQDALTARLDHLDKARKIAQLSATIGRDFPHDLLVKLAERLRIRKPEDKLSELVDAEILYRRGKGERTVYRFKHALVQDAAYRQLISKDRHAYHSEIASVLAEKFPEMQEKQPELLALHYTRADRGDLAIPFWLSAGRKATRSSADLEAMSHFQHGIGLLEKISNKKERVHLELELQVAMGPSLMATHGYSASEVQAAFARAHELCDQVGETPRLIQVLAGLWAYNEVRANLAHALEYAERLHKIGKSSKNEDLLLESHVFLGVTSMHLARLEDSVSNMRTAIRMYDPAKHAAHAYTFGQDPAMAAHAYLADALWLQGHPGEAFREAELAIAHARKLKHPHSLAFALAVGARMTVRQGDAVKALEWAEDARQISEHNGFPVWGSMAKILVAWATSQLQGPEAGVQEMKQVLSGYKDKGTYVSTAYYMGLLAELYGRQQRFDEALELIAEALDDAYSEDRHAKPEILRIRGQLLLMRARPEDAGAAEQSFREALALAEDFGAGGWALKAALSLSQFLSNNEQREEAIIILEPVIAKITSEDTGRNLKAAQELIQSLRI